MVQRVGFADFDGLSPAIAAKVPMEQQLVTAFSQWGHAASEQILPLMEEILIEEMIPHYQRAVIQAFPDIAQTATGEAAERDGNPDHGRGPMFAVLWRTSAVPVGGDGETGNPTLPVVDPEQEPGPGNIYRTESLELRNRRPDLSQRVERQHPGFLRQLREDEPVRRVVARLHMRAVDQVVRRICDEQLALRPLHAGQPGYGPDRVDRVSGGVLHLF